MKLRLRSLLTQFTLRDLFWLLTVAAVFSWGYKWQELSRGRARAEIATLQACADLSKRNAIARAAELANDKLRQDTEFKAFKNIMEQAFLEVLRDHGIARGEWEIKKRQLELGLRRENDERLWQLDSGYLHGQQ